MLKKLLILTHRYVGIAVALLMAAWCLSGIVMMYVGFPALDEEERQAGLRPLDLAGCCAFDATLVSVGDVPIRDFAVERLAGIPVAKVRDEYGGIVVDLRTGDIVDGIDAVTAERIAVDHAVSLGVDVRPQSPVAIETDQWTVTGAYDADRPMYRVALGDPADTHLYVSSATGEVVLDTTARERFWNWFGAVTHWLYPSILRRNGETWSQVVIWTSLIGTFLTVTGLWLGIMQFRAGRSGRFSPYVGWNRWHHVTGLVFGVLLLAWVGSGLVSMTPWGWLAGGSGRDASERLRGFEPTAAQSLSTLQRLTTAGRVPAGTVRIATAPFAGRLYLTLQVGDRITRIDAETLAVAPMSVDELAAGASLLEPGQPIASQTLLEAGDAYYYDDHDGRRRYPVYRVVLDDAEQTRYYIDATDGRLVQRTDRDGRWYRWLFQALHRWDFASGLRQRPLWDLVVLPLLLGVTAISLTGVYLGLRRIRPKRRRAGEPPRGS